MDIKELLEQERDSIVRRALAVAKARGWAESTVSGHILNDGKGLDRLMKGGGLHANSIAKIKAKLDELERYTVPAEPAE